MNLQPPTAFVEGKVGLKRILPTRAEGDADYEPTVSNSFFYFNLRTFYEYDFTVGTEHDAILLQFLFFLQFLFSYCCFVLQYFRK
jgi:hypothetical protein